MGYVYVEGQSPDHGVKFTISLPATVTIMDCATGAGVVAQIVPLTPVLAVAMQASWLSWVDGASCSLAGETDARWDWTAMVGDAHYASSECVCIQTDDGAVQGAMIYKVNGFSYLEPSQKAVFGRYLATAPWNRDRLSAKPAYSRVGAGLVFHAVRHSYLLGLSGRVWLNSFPESLGFYTALGFKKTCLNDDGTIVCELPTVRANEWLAKKGCWNDGAAQG